MKNAKLFSMNLRDVLKGFIVAVLTVVITALSTAIADGSLPDLQELKSIGLIGLSAGMAYLVKNFFTNSDDQILKKEQPK